MDYFSIDQVCDVNPPKDISRFKGMEVSFIPMDAVSTTGEVDVSRTISGDGVKNYSVFQNRDVLFAKITPCMENGKGGIVDDLKNGFGAGSTEFIVIRPDEKKVISEWVQLFLSQSSYRIECKNHMTGSAGQKRVPPKFIAGTVIPVPALDVQRRIVSRIEELFSELDNSVSTLQKTKEQLKVYRQAVLKDAFKGVVEKKPIRQMSEFVTSGSRGWAKYYADEGARFIRITDLTRDKIILKNDGIQRVDLPEETEGKRSRLNPFDVLVSITADLGSIALIPEDIEEAYINQHIAMIRFENPQLGEFMAWYLKSDYGQKDLLKNKRGGGKLGLGLDDIRDTPVPDVSDATSKKIVSEIESRLSVCDSIEHTVDTALQQAEAMRQSILKQAFEGRL